MRFYQLLDVETWEFVYMNPKYIVFYMRTDKGVLIDIGSKQFIVVESGFEDMMGHEGVEAWCGERKVTFNEK